MNGQDTIELFKIYRDYVVHEDGLINNRVNWFIQLHSFLIASYVLMIGALVTTFFPDDPTRVPAAAPVIKCLICAVSIGIAAIGMVSSNSAKRSIGRAMQSLDELNGRWRQRAVDPSFGLPDLAFDDAAGKGKPDLEQLPRVMHWAWLFAIAVSVILAGIAVGVPGA